MAVYRYFIAAFAFTLIGLGGAFWIGYAYNDTMSGAGEALFICAVLAVLEISLSFDNAIVNATILRTMSEKWQRRFLTWGIVIAVFGMRILFPLAIASVAGGIGPIEALNLAASDPRAYAHVMEGAQMGISAFGGAFLMMVAFRFFFDQDKTVHWVKGLEKWLSRFGHVQSIEMGVVLLVIVVFAGPLESPTWGSFVHAAIWGLLTFLGVEAIGKTMDASKPAMDGVYRAGFGAFLYLEVLDASFSFDGVVGAFALSNNLFIIAIGLGIGAFYVRALTILLVENETLADYRYLEHGAFYAILALALIMFLQVHMHIPEVVTGLIGAALIALSFASSVRANRKKVQVG
ncbi:MAG: DUF475 domain-containing protein [Pararhizobium sp.]